MHSSISKEFSPRRSNREGYAHVCPGAPSETGSRSFLIVVNGFSAGRVDSPPASGELEEVCDGHDSAANYHRVNTL